jgi:hypothetical protein
VIDDFGGATPPIQQTNRDILYWLGAPRVHALLGLRMHLDRGPTALAGQRAAVPA